MEIEIRCECGKVLGSDVQVERNLNVFCEVERCKDCIDAAVEDAKKESYDEGYEAGKDEE